jgi:dTDP-4-amino-4,6-dideoxygalactose transaminase
MIPFNKVHTTGKEIQYLSDAIANGKLSGNGPFTLLCQRFFEEKYGIKKALLTTSGTDALEMCAILADIQPEDEVIMPSYTFVSTALPFLRQGAKVVFADSYSNNPNIDATALESLITPKTKAIVVVHYAGIACDMDTIMALASQHNLLVIEDAAQAIDGFFTNKKGETKPLGSIGHLAAFSFHETKNIISGEGGLLAINDERFLKRSEIIWEKGTNRAEFFRGEVNKYGWVDIGSSFLPSELIAAFLWAQLENLDAIQEKRKWIWNTYNDLFKSKNIKGLQLPYVPEFANHNAHAFFIIAKDLQHRNQLIEKLKAVGINAVFHYLSLHASDYYKDKHDGRNLPNSDKFTDCLLRLPLFYDLEIENISKIVDECFFVKQH